MTQQQEAKQQYRDLLMLFQSCVQQTLAPTLSPHLSASQRNHARHAAQHIFHHLAGPVRKTWLTALDAHVASLPSPPSESDAATSLPSVPAPVLLSDLAAAHTAVVAQHRHLSSTLQRTIDSLRANNLQLIPEGSTDIPIPATASPAKRRRTAQPQPASPAPPQPQPGPLLDEDDAARVVQARAEVDNIVDEINELLNRERLEVRELYAFLASQSQSQSQVAAVQVAGGGEVAVGAAGGVGAGAEAGKVGGAGAVVGAGSASSSQLSSPSSGHSKHVAAGLAKRLNRSAAM